MQINKTFIFSITNKGIHSFSLWKTSFSSSIESHILKLGKYIFGLQQLIMPNHIHLIWRIKELNGKETAQGSFLKHTAHQFKKTILKENADQLKLFAVNATNKKHEFWQRDSLAIELYSPNVAFQKLEYIHNNPLQEKWQLAN